ncbi:MAG: YkgJ family cysteine cluster protein [Thermodesulfobacteriota bacterium]
MSPKGKPVPDRAKLNFKDEFRFHCHPGVECYTNCCADVTIFLTPYDVLRLKNRLGLTSRDFMARYTILLSKEGQLLPLVVLKMSEDERKTCRFVTPAGCTVYDDRPWACRMYPLDVDAQERFSVIASAEKCKGLLETQTLTVIEWLETQGVMDYQRVNNYYAEITSNPKLKDLDVTNDQIRRMIYLATYDLDSFRQFVLSTRFKDTFDFPEDFLERVRVDDTELLKLGLDWIMFGLFGRKTLKVKPEVMETHQKRQADVSST